MRYDPVTFDEEITLIGVESNGFDEYGNQVKQKSERRVLANVRSATRAERTEAASRGYQAEFAFTISFYEYQDERKVSYAGEPLDVLNIYKVDPEKIELTTGSRIGK